MKNKLKYGILTITALIILIALTGCGNRTIIATRQDSDQLLGEYSERVEINFEGDAITLIKLTMTFTDSSIADIIANNSENIKFEQNGNTISLELTPEEYKNMYDADFSTMSIDEIISDLEQGNFTIEKK